MGNKYLLLASKENVKMVVANKNMYHNCSQCVAHFCTADKRQNFFFSPQQSVAASEKRKSFSKCNTKRWGDKIHFCTSSFETSIKCDPRARGIMNSYTWVYIQFFAGNIWCKWLEFQFLEEIFAASYLYIQERSNIFVPKTFSASKQNQPQTILSLG